MVWLVLVLSALPWDLLTIRESGPPCTVASCPFLSKLASNFPAVITVAPSVTSPEVGEMVIRGGPDVSARWIKRPSARKKFIAGAPISNFCDVVGFVESDLIDADFADANFPDDPGFRVSVTPWSADRKSVV